MNGKHEAPAWGSAAREATASPYLGTHRHPLARLVEDQPPEYTHADTRCQDCGLFYCQCGEDWTP